MSANDKENPVKKSGFWSKLGNSLGELIANILYGVGPR